MKYKVGDIVLYGLQGVCEIVDITEQNFDGVPTQYYILKPNHDSKSTMYVPVCTEETAPKLRYILSVAEVYELIRTVAEQETMWIENEAERRERYKAVIAGGNRRELISLIKTLHFHKQERKALGKKIHVADERFMKDAEKILYEEFAHVLNIKPEQVLSFIIEQIDLEIKRNDE